MCLLGKVIVRLILDILLSAPSDSVYNQMQHSCALHLVHQLFLFFSSLLGSDMC